MWCSPYEFSMYSVAWKNGKLVNNFVISNPVIMTEELYHSLEQMFKISLKTFFPSVYQFVDDYSHASLSHAYKKVCDINTVYGNQGKIIAN